MESVSNRIRYTDMHCHILPGVDDGARTMEESLEAVDAFLRQGINEVVVTPHFHPGRYEVEAREVLSALEALKSACRETGRRIRLYPGQECYYYSGLISQLQSGRALTMAGSRFVLTEFESDVLFSVIVNAVRSLQQAGYVPLIAHFERYACLYGHEERVEELKQQGAYLQLNFDRLAEKDTLFRKNPWKGYFRAGLIDYLGSDTHGTHFRPLHFESIRKWLEKEERAGMTERIFQYNFDRMAGKYSRKEYI